MTAAAMPVASAWEKKLLGGWSFTVIHGDVEEFSEQAVLQRIQRTAEESGHLLSTYGTNDTTTYIFDADGGRLAVLALQALAVIEGRSWWRTHTRFGGDA